MLIVYGPKPGTHVTFALKISPPREIEGAGGKKIPVPEKRGVSGDLVIQVTAKVPSESNRRAIDAHLERSAVETADGKMRIVGRSEAYNAWRFAAIRELLVKVADLKMVDPRAPDDPEKTTYIRTADDVLELADDDVITGIADVLMGRLSLGEALSGNFVGRFSSSPGANPPLAATVESADGTTSAAPAPAIARPTTPHSS